MTDYVKEIERLLVEADELAFGTSPVALCEEAVRLADQHATTELQYDARMELLSASIFGGFPEKALVAFSWLSAKSDEDPENFPESSVMLGMFLTRVDILWAYKWIAMQLPSFPQIGREQIEERLADMERRYTEHGYSLRPVWMNRCRAAMSMGDDDDEVEECFEAFRRAERDVYADCAACEQGFEVEVALHQDDVEAARVRAEPILDGTLSCAEIPHVTIGQFLLPTLAEGDEEQSEALAKRGYEMCRDNRDFLWQIADYLDYRTVRGDLVAAARIFESHLSWALETMVADRRMRFFNSSLRFLERLAGDWGEAFDGEPRDRFSFRLPTDFALYHEDGEYDVARLHDWFAGEVAELAAAFDARNGNDYISEDTRSHLAEFR